MIVLSLKIWDSKSTDCLHTITPYGSKSETGATISGGRTVNCVVQMPKNMDQILVCNKSTTVYLMNLRGQVCINK